MGQYHLHSHLSKSLIFLRISIWLIEVKMKVTFVKVDKRRSKYGAVEFPRINRRPVLFISHSTEPIWLHAAYLALGLNRYDFVFERSLIRLSLIIVFRKYLNCGMFWVMQTLGGLGHFGGYDQLLFDHLKNLIDIKGQSTDYAWLVLVDQQNRKWSEHRFN